MGHDKEFYDMIFQFEKDAPKMSGLPSLRFDKESIELWNMGNIYQCGLTNQLFKIYQLGYSFGRITYMN